MNVKIYVENGYACLIKKNKAGYHSYLCKDGKVRTPMRGEKDWFNNMGDLLCSLGRYIKRTGKHIKIVDIRRVCFPV